MPLGQAVCCVRAPTLAFSAGLERPPPGATRLRAQNGVLPLAAAIPPHPNRADKRGQSLMTWVLYLIIACGALSIAYGVWTTRAVLAADPGTARMQEIAAAIQEGAQAYLARQYQAVAIVGVLILFALYFLLGLLPAIGFAIGAVLSGAAGYIGMNVSVRANVRTAQAATTSLAAGLSLA